MEVEEIDTLVEDTAAHFASGLVQLSVIREVPEGHVHLSYVLEVMHVLVAQ